MTLRSLDPSAFWIYLAEQPLFFLAITLAAYLVGDRIAAATGRHPLANPVLIAILLVGAALLVSGTSHARYFEGARFVHVLLGPATVALALPIWRNRALIARHWRAIGAALGIGALVGIGSTLVLAQMLGLSGATLASLAPKSVTAAIAMGIAEQVGGTPPLTAVLVIATGILGAVMVTPLMNLLRIRDYAARGFAVGIAAHGIGTARALQVNEKAGAYAALGMALNGLITAILVPLLLFLFR
ncbi:MAG: LrgB family protein [Beijerinckiaceae bacterium]|jgi:predicted murein hydrolase (TIGR00659 family)|nr:LrgB family protein [Beijerinckiaceae bacterium]